MGIGPHKCAVNAGLLVVRAYSLGRRWDLCDGGPSERPQALKNIAAVGPPSADPIFEVNRPLVEQWIG